MTKQKEYLDNTDLYYCPKCNKKELVFHHSGDVYCQVCGDYVEPQPDLDHYDWYFEMLDRGL